MRLRSAAKTLGVYALILLAMVAAGLALLQGAALLPQERVLAHYEESCAQFEEEGYSPFILNRWRADGRLNNRTEFLILQYSAYLDAQADAGAALSNPGYLSAEVSPAGMAEMKAAALAGEAPNDHYVRYWQGFRAVVRTLLTVCHYGDMRRLLLWAYGALAALCAATLARLTGGWQAPLAFALSLLLCNPVVTATSFQFGCCYLLAMAGMLLAAALYGRVRPARLLFGIAVATQYFDFYTTPSLTLVYPLLMWLACACSAPRREGDAPLWREALGCALAWLAGYALMWLCKLGLTTLLTEHDAFANGLGSLSSRLGVVKDAAWLDAYSAPRAFREAFAVLGGLALGVAGAYTLGAGLWSLRKRPARRAWSNALLCAGTGLISVLWIAVAAQPTVLHAYFQYRTLGGLLFAVMLAPAFLAAAAPAKG